MGAHSIYGPSELGAHSIYGPSGLGAIIGCPGKVLAVKEAIARGDIPVEEPESVYAAEGTMLHDVAYKITAEQDRTAYDLLEDEQKNAVDFAVQAGNDICAAEGHCIIWGRPIVAYEQKVDIGARSVDLPAGITDPMFGTVDRLIYSVPNRHLIVPDYKFGRGEVAAVESDQLQDYAFMAVNSWLRNLMELNKAIRMPKKITCVIIQPRVSDKIKTWETDLNGLETWWKTRVLPALRLSVCDNPPRVPSESNCRWCRVAGGLCEAQNSKYEHAFKQNPVETMNLGRPDYRERINQLGLLLPGMQSWCKALAGNVLLSVQDSTGLQDFKAVRGKKGNKAWEDEKKAEGFLSRQGLKKPDRVVEKLISPAVAIKKLTASEKGLSPKAATMLKKYYGQKDGKITFALKTDPREAVVFDDSAAEDALFADKNDINATNEKPENTNKTDTIETTFKSLM